MAENAFKADWPSFALGFNTGKSKGGSGGGGVELNIAYGDTPPRDTSKLWVKTSKPSGVVVSGNGDEEYVATTAPDIARPTAYVQEGRATVGRKTYIFGGMIVAEEKSYDTIYRFDADTGKYTLLSERLPVSLARIQPAVIGDSIYIFGGCWYASNKTQHFSDKIYRFNTATEKIEELNITIATPLAAIGTTAIGDDIYLFGGSASGTASQTDTIYCYNTLDGSLLKLDATIPVKGGVSYTFPNVIDDKIYMVIGAKIYCFDVITETFRTLNVYSPVTTSFNCLFDGAYYQFGKSSDKTIWIFDPMSEKLDELPVTSPVAGSGNTLFVGEEGVYYTVGQTTCFFEKKDIYLGDGVLRIVSMDKGNTFSLINAENTRVEIGVRKVYKGNPEGIGEKIEASLHKDGAWKPI